jgi:hypothetical protein
MEHDDFVSQLDLARAIAAEIDSLTFEFGPDAASHVAALRKQALEQLRQEPRFQAIAREVGQARIAVRQQRIALARKLQSDGIAENRDALDLFLWDSRLIDFFVAHLRPGEKLVAVTGFTLTTNMQVHTRAQIKTACRMNVEMNDAAFQKNFTSDEAVHEAEARAAYREQVAAPGRTGVSNSDWRR